MAKPPADKKKTTWLATLTNLIYGTPEQRRAEEITAQLQEIQKTFPPNSPIRQTPEGNLFVLSPFSGRHWALGATDTKVPEVSVRPSWSSEVLRHEMEHVDQGYSGDPVEYDNTKVPRNEGYEGDRWTKLTGNPWWAYRMQPNEMAAFHAESPGPNAGFEEEELDDLAKKFGEIKGEKWPTEYRNSVRKVRKELRGETIKLARRNKPKKGK
jgi:hypothetical protein